MFKSIVLLGLVVLHGTVNRGMGRDWVGMIATSQGDFQFYDYTPGSLKADVCGGVDVPCEMKVLMDHKHTHIRKIISVTRL